MSRYVSQAATKVSSEPRNRSPSLEYSPKFRLQTPSSTPFAISSRGRGRALLTIPLISGLYRKIENNDSTIAELAAGMVITRCGSTSRIFMRKRSDAIYERVMHLTRWFRLRKKNKPETLTRPRLTVI